MQGKLNEIDIRSILQLIELGQRTGELFVETYSPLSGPTSGMSGSTLKDIRNVRSLPAQSWFVFFANGQIIYAAADTDGNLARLRDYLRRYKLEQALNQVEASAIASTNAPEYGYLWTLLENHVLTPAQGRSIIHSMVRETLFDLLSLHQGAFIFEVGSALAPQLTTLEIGPLVARSMQQVQEWKQFYPYIQSPDQYPAITDPVQLREALPKHIFNHLARWVDGTTSLRQIARYLNRDILMVARAMYPYVQQGLMQVTSTPDKDTAPGTGTRPTLATPLEAGAEARMPRIVCIDDGMTIREAVECILNQHGYEATALGDPIQALSLVFHLKPDLILCDIAMPELDGYEICAMLRKSTAFRQTPIVMLTGKDGFIDRVKARMVGATDYLTKPFGEHELLMLVEKYIGLGNPNSIEGAIAPDLENVLEIDNLKSISASSTPLNS